jgi:hypothetical protein
MEGLRRISALVIWGCVFLSACFAYAQGSSVVSKEFYERRCTSCHKTDGTGDSQAPPINHYKTWTSFARAMDRCPIAPELSDTELELVSNYVVSLSRSR